MHAKRKSAKRAEIVGVKRTQHVDVIDQGAIVKSLGDHIDTRMQQLDFDDDIDVGLFDERDAELRNEATLASGSRQRILSTDVISLLNPDGVKMSFVGHNRYGVTCVSAFDNYIFFGDKSGFVYSACISKGSKQPMNPPFSSSVVSIAVSDTRKARQTGLGFERTTVDHSVKSYVAAGSADGSIAIWKTEDSEFVGILKLHRNHVTGLSFRMDTNVLYSASYDSTVRIWSVPEMLAVDRFFGHQGKIFGISALRKERAATAGEDRTVKYWKLEAATQVEFSKQPCTVECVSMINDSFILAGMENGSLCIYDINKKGPAAVVLEAHGHGFVGDGTGLEKEAILTDGTGAGLKNPNSITAVASVPFTDLGASGSYDKSIRLWSFDGCVPHQPGKKPSEASKVAMKLIYQIPVLGIVTALQFSNDGGMLCAACSKEPRLGRWVSCKENLNGIQIFALDKSTASIISNVQQIAHIPNTDLGTKRIIDELQGFPSDDDTEKPLKENSDASEEEDIDGQKEFEDENNIEMSLFTVGEDGQLIFKDASAVNSSGAIVKQTIGKKKTIHRDIQKKATSSKKQGVTKTKTKVARKLGKSLKKKANM